MELIEQFSQSKTGKATDNEDAFFYNNHFAGVIDGATNVSGRLFNDKTPGQLAAKIIRNAILSLKGNETIIEIIDVINEHFNRIFIDLKIVEEILETPYIRPSAAMIIYSNYHRKIWMIGDCQCFFNGVNYQNVKRVDEVFEEVRSIVMKGELIRGKSVTELRQNDIGFNYILPLIQKQYNFQNASPNCSYSYAVVNGFPIPEKLIKVVDVPEKTNFISFASDGYPNIYESLDKTEIHLEKLLVKDPLCIKENIGTKGIGENNISYDDRTYIKIRI